MNHSATGPSRQVEKHLMKAEILVMAAADDLLTVPKPCGGSSNLPGGT